MDEALDKGGTGGCATRPGTLWGVGVGPGDPELVTLKAVRVIEACPVVAAVRSGAGVAAAFEVARRAVPMEGKRVVWLDFPMSRDAAERAACHEEAARAVCAELAAGRDVAMPVLGDASLYATFQRVRPLVEAAGFSACAVPGVPSFCAVAARLGVDLTPRMDAPLHVLPAGYADVGEALALPGSKVFMKAGGRLGELARAVRATGGGACGVTDCGLAGERAFGSLEEMPDSAGYLTTVVVRP